MKKTRILSLAMTGALCLSLLAGCGGGNGGTSETPASGTPAAENTSSAAAGEASGTFTIGMIGPLTGGAAIYGTAVANAAKIAADELNALGGLQIEIDAQDDEHDPEKAINAYNTVLDNGANATALNSELITLIVEALIFGLIISVLLSFLLSKTLTTPIERLTEGAERVADGDFSHKIEVASRDEIGVLTGTFNDMAQQLKRTLEEVENERTKLGTLFLHMTDGVVAFSRDGTVIQSNPAAEQMLGRAIPIGGGESYDTLFSDVAPLQGVLAVEQPGYLDGEREVDGRSLELLLTPFDQERLGGVLVVIHDVTEQRKTEEMRREFVANVSHELRTPLTNIRSYAETLADNAGDIPPETEKNFLGVILNESDRMTHIVQDLLTLSRFDSGRSELNLAPFDFGEAVRDVYQANRLEAQRHGHTMELELPGSLPEIVGDRERILQVMMNVVSNSIKYTPDGGRIRLSAGVQGKRVWMEVTDNGIGIPKEDRGRIFERFYRVDKARSRESGGTGLGLSIAKEIVQRHHGTIALAPHEGPGTTIRLTLPIGGPSNPI